MKEKYPRVTETMGYAVTELMLTMKDGVRLYSRCLVPKSEGRYPTVFIRTPYEDDVGTFTDSELEKNEFLRHGYAVFISHVRGRGKSEGVCIPYESERDDGLCTLEYIRKLPFYNGEIYLYGKSYLASVHYSYLADKPPDIRGAVFEVQTDRMYERNFRYGMNYSLLNAEWWFRMLSRKYTEQKLDRIRELPYKDICLRVVGEDVPQYTDLLMHDVLDEYHESDTRRMAAEAIDFPVLLIEGWYDFYIGSMPTMWDRLSEDVRKRSAMIIGPYGHDTAVSKDFELAMKNTALPEGYASEFFDSVRKGRAFSYALLGAKTLYSVGADGWRKSSEADATSEEYLFPSSGGSLGEEPSSGSLEYIYDPRDGRGGYRFGGIYAAGGLEDGVLTFVSRPRRADASYLGKMKLDIEVSSDAEDTAFFARLYLVREGRAYNLTETVFRLSYFVPDYKPHERVAVGVEFTPIAFTLRVGDSLRLDISSKSGVYTPHPNVKGHFATVNSTRVARNTVYTDHTRLTLVRSDAPFSESTECLN